MTLRKASNNRTTLQTISLAVCRRRYALLVARMWGERKKLFSDLFTRFSAFKYIWYCYKFRPAHFGLIKIYIGSWNRYLGSSILVSSLNMCFGSRVFGSWQLRQFWVQLVYLSLADLRQISTDLLHSFSYVRAR
jgi:hypothetical protein